MDRDVRQRLPIKNLVCSCRLSARCLKKSTTSLQQLIRVLLGWTFRRWFMEKSICYREYSCTERERGAYETHTHTHSQTLVWLRREGLMIRGGPSLMCNNIWLEVSHSVAPLAPKNHPMWMQPEAVHKQNSTDTHAHTHTNYSTCLRSVFLIDVEMNHV